MKNKYTSRIFSMLAMLALISTTCAWIPFTAPFTIHTEPEGATVYKSGGTIPLGTTPYKSRIFHIARTYDLKLAGFIPDSITIDFNAAKDTYVKLKTQPVMLSTKPYAEVYAAGAEKPMGTTPLQINVYEKDRTYTLKAENYQDKEITIGTKTKSPMAIELDRRPFITLSAGEGVEIYENDKRVATTSMTEEILTKRTFELRKEGYYSKTVELTSASPENMSVELEPLPIVEIQSVPNGAAVYLVGDDKPIGNTPLNVSIEKATGFEVRADRYYPETFTAEAKPQQAKAILVAMPYVMITSDPSGAEVLLDGKLLGTTPLEQLIEQPTTYKIRKEGFRPQSVTLNGKEAQPSIKLEAAPVVKEETVVEEPAVVEAPVEVVEAPAAEAPVEQGMNLPLIGGIGAAVIAAILIILLKKKKSA